MPMQTTTAASEGYDASPDFVYAVSLVAALEGATDQEGHALVLPFLGMARAELTDFGQRRPTRYVPVQVDDLRAGLAELDGRITALLAGHRGERVGSDQGLPDRLGVHDVEVVALPCRCQQLRRR